VNGIPSLLGGGNNSQIKAMDKTDRKEKSMQSQLVVTANLEVKQNKTELVSHK